MIKFTKIKKDRNLYEDVIKAIKNAILAGAFPSGSPLPSETELARQFEVSRPVIREALRALQSSGFIDIKRGIKGGAFVRGLNRLPLFDDFESFILHRRLRVNHLAQARLFLEPEVCRLAATHATADDIANIKAQVGSYATAPADNKDGLYIEFHRLVGRACGNPIYALLMENIMDFTEGFLQTIRPVQTLIHHDDDHDEILLAIENRDPQRAAAVATRHAAHILEEMQKLEEVYLALLREEVAAPDTINGEPLEVVDSRTG